VVWEFWGKGAVAAAALSALIVAGRIAVLQAAVAVLAERAAFRAALGILNLVALMAAVLAQILEPLEQAVLARFVLCGPVTLGHSHLLVPDPLNF
jgi:hypothetical protein